jgi:hypothetical protein
MAGSKRRSPTSTLVSKGSIQKAGSALGVLPEKPKEIWSLREAIDALKDEITLALDRGYTYPEISQMLTDRGVEISASTLKYYLSAVKRQDPNAKPRRRRRTLGAGLSADTLNLSLSGETAPKKRGRQPKAAVEVAAAPKKRGRQPKAVAEVTPVKKPKGRPPKAKAADVAPVKATRTPKATAAKAPKAPKAAKAVKATKVARTPKATAAKVTKASKAVAAKAPKVAKATKVTKAAKVAKAAPKATKATATKGVGRGRKKAVV